MDDYISLLLERFLSSQKDGQNAYFDADDIVELIEYFLDKDDTANLETAIKLGCELHPDDINFKIALCKSLIAMEDYKSAMRIIEGLGLQDDKDIAIMRLECLFELGRRKEAFLSIDKMKEENSPYLEEALEQAACILNDMEGMQNEAYRFIKEALALYPDNFYLRNELCYNYELQGKTQEALLLCDTLIDERPYFPELWYMKGRLYAICADFERAADSLDFALTCLEDDEYDLEEEIKIMKAYCLFRNESYEMAIELYKELAAGGGDSLIPKIGPFFAECYISVGEYEKAYRILRKALRFDKVDDKAAVYGNFIYCCFKTGRKDEAIRTLGESLDFFPQGVLEYLSKWDAMKKHFPDAPLGDGSAVRHAELIREYIIDDIHKN